MSVSKPVKKTISETYQKKSQREHILDNPDTYTGSMELSEDEMYVFDNEGEKIISRKIKYIPGFYKLFDEAIVNCRDHVIRMQQAVTNDKDNNIPVTNINITLEEDGTITMINDGNGLDIVKHPEHDIWIPEMVVGHLRTSTNYDKNEKKITGGKNDFGIKLAFIWTE